jgi:beta-phosphoglucomutase-like phosphatase (HAD superfamily)
LNIRAVFWDVDGTMVMSEDVHHAKTRSIAARHGIVVTAEMEHGFYGTSDKNVHNILQNLGMPDTLEKYLESCIDYYRDNLHMVELREGFMEVFVYLEQSGALQCAVSNGVNALVQMNIERSSLGKRLKAVIDIDHIYASGLNPKPAADPYLEALRQINETEGLNIRPSECLVIEDSPTGARAGKAAGMNVILWKLFPEKTLPEADHEAHTGADLMEIIKTLQFLGQPSAA